MQPHNSIAGDFPSIFRVLQCYPLTHTSSPPAGCQLWHSWHRKGAGSCISFHDSVASISVGLLWECMAGLGGKIVRHFHLLMWFRERFRSDSELSHTCRHTVLTCRSRSHRSCLHCLAAWLARCVLISSCAESHTRVINKCLHFTCTFPLARRGYTHCGTCAHSRASTQQE